MIRQISLSLAIGITVFVNAQSEREVRPKTMEAKFRNDSIEQNETYFLRINHVKRMEEKGKDSKTVTEYDIYGNEISNKWYLDKELYSSTVTTYNEFGDAVTRKTVYFDDNEKPETVFITNSFYKVDPSGLTELCIRDESSDTYFRDGLEIKVSSVTNYTYDSNGQITSTVTTGKKGYCTDGPKSYRETDTYTYDSHGNILTHSTVEEGGCDGGESSSDIYTYDSLGREIKSVHMENGKPDHEIYTEYDELGRDKKWIGKNPDGEERFEFIFEYESNGLKKSCTSIYKGEKDYEEYSYEYF